MCKEDVTGLRFAYNSQALIRSLLNNAGSADFLESRDEDGNTSLFDGIENFMDCSIELLLQRGANVHARNAYGENCLHFFFAKVNKDYLFDINKLMQILLLLARCGADIDAVNTRGVSVTEYAYIHESVRHGFSGDLWDRLLVERGYDLLPRRKAFPRRPTYTVLYPRSGFEEIWAGWEQHCPYYDDPPEWPSAHLIHSDPAQSEAYQPVATIVKESELPWSTDRRHEKQDEEEQIEEEQIEEEQKKWSALCSYSNFVSDY